VFQATEMLIGFFQWKRSANERHFTVVVKTILVPTGTIGSEGNLGASAQVNSPQYQDPI
jgi:hypothetical protein